MSFPWEDIREFINHLESIGQLARIKVPVDPELEITEITDRMVKSSGPALLFDNVIGSQFSVLINTFGSRKRMEAALGVDDYQQIAGNLGDLLKPNVPHNWWERIKKLPKLVQLAGIVPQKRFDLT